MSDDKYKKLIRRIKELNAISSKFDYVKSNKNGRCIICKRNDAYSKLTGKCIFHCEKNDWYSIDNNQDKVWDSKKVKEFWKDIYNNYSPDDNANFNHFIFPKFSDNNFWQKDQTKNFKKGAVFLWCKFLDDAKFFEVKFEGNLIFYFCKINGLTDFRCSKFEGITDFKNNYFKNKVYFTESLFKNDGRFGRNNFLEETYFSNCQFLKNLEFQDAIFFKKAELSLIQCLGKADFTSTQFLDESTFWLSKFKKANFQGAKFSKIAQTLFQETLFGKADFSNIIFSENAIFRRAHIENVIFRDSKIDTAQFSECFFNEFLKRKVIYDEILINKRKKGKIFNKKNKTKTVKFLEKIKGDTISSKDYEEIEELNRQLKKNFESKSDFETAGDFHIGEMEMRRRKFAVEIKEKNNSKNWFTRIVITIWNYLFINSARRFLLFWYNIFSIYGESPGRVIISIFSFCLIFFFLYWWSFDFAYINILKSIGVTVENFIPFLPKLNLDTANFFQRIVFDIEIFISAILWFLLLISIRRKFKR